MAVAYFSSDTLTGIRTPLSRTSLMHPSGGRGSLGHPRSPWGVSEAVTGWSDTRPPW